MLHNPIVLAKLMVSQGFDLWFTQACFAVNDLKKVGMRFTDLMNTDLLHEVRSLVEDEFCRGKGMVSELDPALLRFIHKIDDRCDIQDFTSIRKRGDTTDEEEAKAKEEEKQEEKPQEEEKKG